jgi:hypothetical protein
MEKIQRITGWMTASAEHSVIRVVDEGIECEGVVLGGSVEEPFAIRYAVMAYPDGGCRCVTARAIGYPILLELYADGNGRWTDDDGAVICELEGAVDVDLGITPVTHALTIGRLGLAVGESTEISVAGLDVLAGEIRLDGRRYVRVGEDHYRVEDAESAASTELRWLRAAWTIEVLSAQDSAVTC